MRESKKVYLLKPRSCKVIRNSLMGESNPFIGGSYY